jgi:diadenosine tetraphosphate (Ap4A) HIT family hydrolase
MEGRTISDQHHEGCVFCRRVASGPLLAYSEHAAAFPDRHPVSPGHVLVVPRRHVEDVFRLAEEEQTDLWRLLARMRSACLAERSPDGFNVGINVGKAAGQTVLHAHVHLIPRYAGDAPDPRGGVRWVMPDRAPYWEAVQETDEEGRSG